MKLVWQGYQVYCEEQNPMKVDQVQVTSDHQVMGMGSDSVGDFVIIGQVQGTPADGNINFIKQYIGQHQILYKGVCKNGVIKGKWGLKQNEFQQDFMLQMNWPPTKMLWQGYYVQFGIQHPMEFQNVGIYKDGKITAQGTDQVGDFQIRGQANGSPANCQIRFTKQYIGMHRIFYSGECFNGIFKGYWGFSEQYSQEPFMIQMKQA